MCLYYIVPFHHVPSFSQLCVGVCVFMFQGLQRTLMKSTKPIMGIWLSSFKGDRSR